GSLLSNELKAPDEQLWSAPGTTNVANPQFWDMNGVNCAGHFNVTNSAVGQTILLAPPCTDLSPVAPAGCHTGVSDTLSRNNRWGVEVTSVRFDRFPDTSISTACPAAAGGRRESAPPECQLTPNADVGDLHAPTDPALAGEPGHVAAVPALHRRRCLERGLLPDLVHPRQRQRSLPGRTGHPWSRAVLLSQRGMLRPEQSGCDLCLRRRAVQ